LIIKEKKIQTPKREVNEKDSIFLNERLHSYAIYLKFTESVLLSNFSKKINKQSFKSLFKNPKQLFSTNTSFYSIIQLKEPIIPFH